MKLQPQAPTWIGSPRNGESSSALFLLRNAGQSPLLPWQTMGHVSTLTKGCCAFWLNPAHKVWLPHANPAWKGSLKNQLAVFMSKALYSSNLAIFYCYQKRANFHFLVLTDTLFETMLSSVQFSPPTICFPGHVVPAPTLSSLAMLRKTNLSVP